MPHELTLDIGIPSTIPRIPSAFTPRRLSPPCGPSQWTCRRTSAGCSSMPGRECTGEGGIMPSAFSPHFPACFRIIAFTRIFPLFPAFSRTFFSSPLTAWLAGDDPIPPTGHCAMFFLQTKSTPPRGVWEGVGEGIMTEHPGRVVVGRGVVSVWTEPDFPVLTDLPHCNPLVLEA